MAIREALTTDLAAIKRIRASVKENILSNPALVTDQDIVAHQTSVGKGWVWEENGEVLGFCHVNFLQANIWSLFIDPAHEGKGIGKELHRVMLDWYFGNYSQKLWLGTDPGTRAEEFYQRQGWKKSGYFDNGEVRFEISKADWGNQNRIHL